MPDSPMMFRDRPMGGKMRRMAVSVVACCLVFALFLTGCKKNEPPAAPELSGPTVGAPGKSLAFTWSTTDPENQNIAYLVDWGDDTEEDWDPNYLSGEEVRRVHKFRDSGVYVVKVKARDQKEAESDWSNKLTVTIGFAPPNQPGMPTGPASCTTGVAAIFTARTTHPLGDSVWFQFDWGDTIGDWGGPVASDSAFNVQHSFDTAGTYNVKVRAKDVRDKESPWSDPLVVTVIFVEAPAQPAVSLEPLGKGAQLRLTWPGVADADHYEVTVDTTVLRLTDTTYTASPCTTLEVRAAKGSRRSTPAVIPVHMAETASVAIYAISDTITSHPNAFGIDSTGLVTTYTRGTGNYPKMDYYANDLTHLDTMFLINAGKPGWNTKLNVLKDAATTIFEDAKLADTAAYVDETPLVSGEVYYLWFDETGDGWSLDDNFAKAKVISVSGPQVTLRIGYQRVGGLRWLGK